MSLLGNYSVLHKSPAKYLTGTVGYGDRSNFNKPGMMRNRGSAAIWRYDAQPSGTYAGRAYFSPVKAGRLVSRTSLKVDAAADGGAGVPASASAAFSIEALAFGGLIAGGVATASISVAGSAAIAGRAAGSAGATITIQASAGLGASAFGVANSTITVTASCQPYGRGYMQASTVDTSVLTPQAIAASVWSALAAGNNTAGTMGARLNAAGAAADPWSVTLEGTYTAADLVRIMASVLAGSATGTNQPGETAFKSLDGGKDRVVSQQTDGARTTTALDGS